MSYINANDILPKELINEIQKYVQGVNLYIPKIFDKKKADSEYKKELLDRNMEIYEMFQSGNNVSELAKMYYLSDKSIYRILGQMVGDKYLQEDYWKYLSEVIIMMYHTAKLYSDMGKNVLIDGIIVEREEIKPHYEQLLDILKDNPLDIVEVYCPIDICRKRNCLREDRYEAQSEEQLELMAKNIRYSMKVDTSVYTPAECAEIIVKELFV